MSGIIDYLLRFASVTSRDARLWDWREGEEYQMPAFCGGIDVQAFTTLGTPPTYDEQGEVTDPGTARTPATGRWVLVSLGKGEPLPAALLPYVKAFGAREDGIAMPTGIALVEPLWAGMTVKV